MQQVLFARFLPYDYFQSAIFLSADYNDTN